MQWINTKDITKWADTRDCQETLPLLIRKLIRATSGFIKNINFPSGENVLIGGWDGILEVSKETEYFPLGISLWEFGASKGIKKKADDDYNKRTSNPLGFKLEELTYIFVTPRLWTQSDKWVEDKKVEKKWKDIKVIKAEILEEWLDIAPSVGVWLAYHIGKLTDKGIRSTDDYWDEWSIIPKFNLNPDLLLGGRETERKKILKTIDNPILQSVKGLSLM